MSDTMLSRSGRTDPGDKKIARLDIPVSEQTEHDVIGLAVALGIPKAELCRQIIERSLYGEVSLLRKATRAAGLGRWDESPSNGGADE